MRSAQLIFAKIPVLRDWSARKPHGVVSPVDNIAFTGPELLILLIVITVTGRVEKRSLR
jgi:hypothetical protein